jgi:hypothetical protein
VEEDRRGGGGGGIRVVPRGKTDGHVEAVIRFSQMCERVLGRKICLEQKLFPRLGDGQNYIFRFFFHYRLFVVIRWKTRGSQLHLTWSSTRIYIYIYMYIYSCTI